MFCTALFGTFPSDRTRIIASPVRCCYTDHILLSCQSSKFASRSNLVQVCSIVSLDGRGIAGRAWVESSTLFPEDHEQDICATGLDRDIRGLVSQSARVHASSDKGLMSLPNPTQCPCRPELGFLHRPRPPCEAPKPSLSSINRLTVKMHSLHRTCFKREEPCYLCFYSSAFESLVGLLSCWWGEG